MAEIYSPKRDRTEHFGRVALESGDRRAETSVEQLWFHDGKPVFKFLGIDSISEAEAWEGADVLIPSESKLPLAEGEYSYSDLIGCRLMTNGMPVGVVQDVHEYGGPVTLVVETTAGKEALVPFVGAICRKIDTGAKVIEANLPEGLLEL